MPQSYPARDIWGMIPVTKWIINERDETMQASAAEFGQAQQGLMLAAVQPQQYVQQYVPVGQDTRWEIEERSKVTELPAIEYGGLRMGESVPIVVTPYDELEKRFGMSKSPFMGQVPIKVTPEAERDQPYSILPSNHWSGINLRPLGLEGRRVRIMGQFDAAPLTQAEVAAHQPYAMVDPLTLAYSTGAYIRAGAPEWGRFPVMPPGITYRV